MTSAPVSDPLREMESLTKRQREVLALAAKGMTNPEIGDRLGISKDGAKWHIGEILMRLDVDTREEAVDLWRRYHGLPYRLHRVMRAVLGPVAVRWLLGGVGATAVAGLAVVLVVLAVQGGDESQSDVTPAASVSPTVAAASPATSPTAASSPTIDAAGGYRTGNPDIDPVLEAIESADPTKLIAVTQFMQIGCMVQPKGIGAPPQCPTGVADGTPMDVIPGGSGEGTYTPKANYEQNPVVPGIGLQLYAIYRNPADYQSRSDWPVGDYTIVYIDPTNLMAASVAVADGKIVNRFFAQTLTGALRDATAADFILAPKTP